MRNKSYTPSTADNSCVADASCGRDPEAAVLDWRNAMTKSEPGPGEMVIDQASSRRVVLPPDISQVVLVLQGGGALGAYQVGVYQALHEAGIEPDWVIGTSIGAINASLIAVGVADALAFGRGQRRSSLPLHLVENFPHCSVTKRRVIWHW